MNENDDRNPLPGGPPARVVPSLPAARPVPTGFPLTKSDRLFIKAYGAARTMPEAGRGWALARKARPYKNDESAGSAAGRKLQEVRRKCEAAGCPEAMWEEAGLTMRDIVAVLRDGMVAMKVEPMRVREETIVQVRDAKGNVRDRVVSQERIVEAGPYVDHRSRTDAARLAAQLRGDLRGNRANTGEAGDGEGGNRVTFEFNVIGPTQVVVPPKGSGS